MAKKTYGRPVHDPQVLRAIAHPTRNRILTELSASGSMRAADIARELAIPANQVSFHLRQLAKYGLIEDDPDASTDRRDRMWRSVDGDGLSINLKELEEAPGGRAASEVYRRSSAAWVHHLVDVAHGTDRPEGAVFSTSEHAIRLTGAEAREMYDELLEVLSRWTEKQRGRDPERTTYLLYAMMMPYPDLPSPASPASPGED